MNKFQIGITFLCLGLLTACGGGSSSAPTGKQPGPAVLQSIQITPGAPSIAAGISQQFIATATYSDNTNKNLTGSAAWSSSNTSIANISNVGAATGKEPGSTTITATVSGVSGSVTLAVTAPALVSLAVTPTSSSVPVGTTVQFGATGTFTDGSTQNLTTSVLWMSASASVAAVNVNGTQGLAMGMAVGSSSISAASGSVSASAMLTITNAVLNSLALSPQTASIAQGTTVQFAATGIFTDGSMQNLTSSVQWSSANTAIAGINWNGAPGLAKANGAGTSTISATAGSVSASAVLTVTNASLTSIAVTPVTASFPLGTLQQFTAMGAFSDGTTQDITGTTAWSSSNTGVASITVSGLFTARNLGTVTITAASGSINGSTSASVNAADLASIAILPGNITVAATTSQQFAAIGTFNDGSTRNLTSQAVWTTSSAPVAKVGNSSGLVRALSPGIATISATLGSAGASVAVEVTNAQVVSISITPAGSTIAPATTLSLTATGAFSDSSTQVISRDVTWASDNIAVATVGPSGMIAAVASGTANIQASINGVTAAVPVNVSSVTLTSIALNPATATLAPASTLSYAASGTFSDGSSQIITNAVTWSSSAPNVANAGYGQATAQSPGTAVITAQQGSISGSSNLVVESSPLISMQITPASATVAQQTMAQFRATGTFADGSTQDLTSSVSWTSSPLSVATVSDAVGTKGLAAGLAPGTATITALFAGEVGTASLSVTGATLTSLTLAPNAASIPVGTYQQFTATGNFSDGTTQNLTTLAAWASSSVNVATITGSGLANAAAAGTTTLTASINGLTENTVLTVY
ncbi:MAG: Ig-like domain-containing protein [Terriglobales bacterium]